MADVFILPVTHMRSDGVHGVEVERTPGKMISIGTRYMAWKAPGKRRRDEGMGTGKLTPGYCNRSVHSN
jgi:hypothetical protein